MPRLEHTASRLLPQDRHRLLPVQHRLRSRVVMLLLELSEFRLDTRESADDASVQHRERDGPLRMQPVKVRELPVTSQRGRPRNLARTLSLELNGSMLVVEGLAGGPSLSAMPVQRKPHNLARTLPRGRRRLLLVVQE